MATKIAVAGATGNLGGRIIEALVRRGAEVRALVRPGTAREKLEKLTSPGVHVTLVDMTNPPELARAFEGVSCVVSALLGLRDVLVDAQTTLVDAAISAGVPRFIPSDYSIDFMKVPAGENRNFDIHREFAERLEGKSIASTSILNGAFAELLLRGMRMLDLGKKSVSYWESADQRMDFTTMDDTSAFTAAAALDDSTPRFLRIAGDQVSPRDLARIAGEVKKAHFELVRSGSLEDLAAIIHRERTAHPESEKETFPMWQGLQYMHNMFSGKGKLEPLDNDRYPDIRFTSVRALLGG